MSNYSKEVNTHLKIVKTKSNRAQAEIKFVNELFTALDNNDMGAADAAIKKIKPSGKLKIVSKNN